MLLVTPTSFSHLSGNTCHPITQSILHLPPIMNIYTEGHISCYTQSSKGVTKGYNVGSTAIVEATYYRGKSPHNCLFWDCPPNLCSQLAGKHVNDPHTARLLLDPSIIVTIFLHTQQEASFSIFPFVKTSSMGLHSMSFLSFVKNLASPLRILSVLPHLKLNTVSIRTQSLSMLSMFLSRCIPLLSNYLQASGR